MKAFNIAMLLECFVCLSVMFTFLNRVTDCYKSGVNILIKLEALGSLKFQFQTLSNYKQDVMRTFELWAILLTINILCATGSWRNVKIYWVYMVIEWEIAKWRHCICLVEFYVTMKMDDGKWACVFWYGVNYVHFYTSYTKYCSKNCTWDYVNLCCRDDKFNVHTACSNVNDLLKN